LKKRKKLYKAQNNKGENMHRRVLLKRLGWGVLALATVPFLAPAEKAFASIRVDNPETIYANPLLEGVPPEGHILRSFTPGENKPLEEPEGIKWYVQPLNVIDYRDPLGQFGFVAAKWEYKGNRYGDWVRISWDFEDMPFEPMVTECKRLLLEKRLEKIKLIDAYPRMRQPWSGFQLT
jgi:hypothetical protein